MANPDTYINNAEKKMKKALDHFKKQLTKVRAGKASPDMLEDITVDYYGVATPITQAATVKNIDAKTLLVQPWEKKMLEPIEKEIQKSDLGITPQNDGEVIRLPMPPLTEERRKEMVKQIKKQAEDARITIRKARQEANNKVKELQSEGLSEDGLRQSEKEIQELTDKYNELIDKHFEAKKKELMKV